MNRCSFWRRQKQFVVNNWTQIETKDSGTEADPEVEPLTTLNSTSSLCGDHETKDRDREGTNLDFFYVLPTRPLGDISNLTSSTTSIVELL